MGNVIITRARRQDFFAIIEVERESFADPWDAISLSMTLDDPLGYNIVAFMDGKLAGYCFAHELKEMLHLLNLAIRPDFRRKGVGKKLMEKLLMHARQHHKNSVFLEVRTSNEAAKSLYASLGFIHATTWKKYYRDSGEDAEVYIKRFT